VLGLQVLGDQRGGAGIAGTVVRGERVMAWIA